MTAMSATGIPATVRDGSFSQEITVVSPVIFVKMPLSRPYCGLSTYCQMTATATAEVSTGMKKTVRRSGRSRRAAASIITASGKVISRLSGSTMKANTKVTIDGGVERLGQLDGFEKSKSCWKFSRPTKGLSPPSPPMLAPSRRGL